MDLLHLPLDFDKLRILPSTTSEELEQLEEGILALAKIGGTKMRLELKFRVRYHGKMIVKSLNDLLVEPANNFMFLDSEVMQFIGHYDKNGEEIYGDDIVKADWCWTEPHRIIWPHDEYDFIEFGLDIANVEIIGNSYDHPELVELKMSSDD